MYLKTFFFACFLIASSLTMAGTDEDEFLPVHEAFNVRAQEAGNHIHFTFEIAEGYYLYKHRFGFDIKEGTKGAIGEPVYQQSGKWKNDPTFGRVEVFYSKVDIYVPVSETGEGFIEVDARYQGCAEKGLCYIPQTFTNMYQVDTEAAAPSIKSNDSEPNKPDTDMDSALQPENQLKQPLELNATPINTDVDTDNAISLKQFLSSSSLLSIIGVFFLVGIGLTFTPCVLPMIPILSSIIVGQGNNISRTKAGMLSLFYVLGMAFTYAILGVIAGVTGAKLQVALQNPVVLIGFASVFLMLSFSMFGFYELQLPQSLQSRLNNASQKQKGGTYFGVAIIGMLSALVVSPCVSAPLAGALLYIGQTGDWLLGGSSLLALGLGMGAPLIVIGVTGANFLPNAGGWMDNVKGIFGVILLAVALWLVKHLLPDTVLWVTAGLLLILCGLYFGALDNLNSPKAKLFKAIGITALLCGASLILNTFLSPSSTVSSQSAVSIESNQTATNETPFQRIRSEAVLDKLLAEANQNQQPVMIDYFAKWCTACLEMEHETFSQPDVQVHLKQHLWIQIDLTDNPEDQALLSRFGLLGPPAILFFDQTGDEIQKARIYAYKSKSQFMAHLTQHHIKQ